MLVEYCGAISKVQFILTFTENSSKPLDDLLLILCYITDITCLAKKLFKSDLP